MNYSQMTLTDLIALSFYVHQKHFEFLAILEEKVKPLAEMGKNYDEIYNQFKDLDDKITAYKTIFLAVDMEIDNRLLK